MAAADDLTLRRSSAAHVFVAPEQLDGAITLDEVTERHLDRVLRLRDGEPVSITDGAGRWRQARLFRSVEGIRLEPAGDVREHEQHIPMTLAVAMPKGDRLDQLVQKTTELGIDALVLLHCERSVARWKDDRVDWQRARLQRIADEACRQSRRVWRVAVEGPVAASAILTDAVVAEPGGRPLDARDTLVAIGPEGGWSERELESAGDRVDLGHTVLRTETASIVAAALMMAARRSEAG
jgi:16S rRNA (uracil1498-N3)-methyltransferase